MKLINNDCLVAMKEIPDGSVDMVLADPPYGTTACKWDSIIPLEPMWEQLKRVIKPNGAIVMTASQPFTTTLISSNMKMFKYCWVWNKRLSANGPLARFQPLKITEDVVIFGDGRVEYFPQGTVTCNKVNYRSNTEIGNSGKHKYIQKVTNFPKNIIDISSAARNKKIHPTQKPVALMEYLIKTYTNEGETVLDFTMGSGTTGVACANLNRDFIGIEKDLDYFNIALERIEKAQKAKHEEFFFENA